MLSLNRMNIRRKLLPLATILSLSCAPDISIKKELVEYCLENPAAGLCQAPKLEEELAAFCTNNPQLLLCVNPADAMAILINYCMENADSSLCNSESSSLGDLCAQNSQIDLCQQIGVEFVVSPASGQIWKKSFETGSYLTVSGEMVPYQKQTILYQDGIRLSEIVFPQGVKDGTIIEASEMMDAVKLIPGVISSSGDVGIVYLSGNEFKTIFVGEKKETTVCDDLTLVVDHLSSDSMNFQVKLPTGDVIAETTLQRGDYSFLLVPSVNCDPGFELLLANAGDSYLLAPKQYGEQVPIVTVKNCLSVLLGKGDGLVDFFIPAGLAKDGYIRNIIVNHDGFEKVCPDLYNQ